MIEQPAVYILASARNGTLYIGVTSNLIKRIWEHKNNMVEGFTKRYGVHHLVWFRASRKYGFCYRTRKEFKGMETPLEIEFGRKK